MNGLLRIVKHFGIACLLAVGLAASAAVALAESGSNSGKDSGGQTTTDNSGKGNADDRTTTETTPADDHPQDGDDKGNDGDRGNSEDHRRDGTGTLPNPGKAHQGEDLNVEPTGTVKIRLPGERKPVRLKKGASVPVGSVLDAREGGVKLTTVPREDGAKQWAAFSGAIFKVSQRKSGKPVTDIRLRGGSFASCGRPFGNRSLLGRVFASSSRSRKVRSLWGRGKGHFRTRGRNGAATVRGTVWLTEDRCDGTLVRVRRGLVAVHDFKKHKFVDVPAGHSYLARR
jgi:hypothetical protein